MKALSPFTVKWLKAFGALLLLAISILAAASVVPHLLRRTDSITDGSNLTTEERIEVMNRMVSTPDDPTITAFDFPQLFKLTCETAKPKHFNALAKIFADCNDGDSTLFPSIATLFLEIEIRKMKANPPPKITLTPVNLDRQTIPPQLLEAHQLAGTVAGPFLALSTSSSKLKTGVSYHEERNQWAQLMNRFFLGDQSIRTEDILTYRWGSFCGVGAGSFLGPHSVLTFLSLVRDGRHSEALGAALFLHNGNENHPNEFSHLLRAYFSICGLDASKVALGMLANYDLQNESYWENRNSLLQLAAEGSPREAMLLIEIARKTKWNVQREYIITLGALLAPKTSDDIILRDFGSSPDPRERLRPATDEVQAAIFQFFDEFTTFKTDPYALRSLADLLGSLRRSEGEPILMKLMKNPDPTVAKAAADALMQIDR